MVNFMEWLRRHEALSHGGARLFSSDPAEYERAMGVRDDDSRKGNPFYYAPFNRRDRAMISDPSYWDAIKRTLSRSESAGGFDWNIVLLELDPTRSNFRQYQSMVDDYMSEHGLRREGHITFAKNRSSGDGVSRWILFHNAAHAAFERNMEAANAPHKRAIERVLNEVFIAHQESHGLPPDGNRFHVMQVASRLFPHKSGVNAHAWRDASTAPRAGAIAKRGISSVNEMVYDLVAQHIVTGRVRLTGETEHARRHLEPGVAPHQTGSYAAPELPPNRLTEDFLARKSSEIQRHVEAALRNCVGEVIYHYRPIYGSTTPVPDHRVRPGSTKLAKVDPRDHAEPFDRKYRITPDHSHEDEDEDTGVADWLRMRFPARQNPKGDPTT